MKTRETVVRGSWPLALGLVTLALTACRSESERSAMGQVPVGGHGQATVTKDDTSLGSEATLRRVWSGPGLDASAVSPDGRWVSTTDWTTGDLAVQDLAENGESPLRRITNKDSWQTSGDYALSSAFSPDGDRVAYNWFRGERDRHELRILDFATDDSGDPLGSNPRVVYERPDLDVYSVLEWSADDRVLVLLRRPDRSTALALISVLDGGVKVLESFGWRTPKAARSPGGRFIAYDVPPDDGNLQRDIFLLSTDGEHKVVLANGPVDEIVLGWSPAGDGLLIASRREGRTTISQIPMSDGTPSGPPLFVEEIAGRVTPIGWAGEALHLAITVEHNGFQVADLDLYEARILPPPIPIELPDGGVYRGWDWSPDGRHYAVGVQPERRGGFLVVIGRSDGTELTSFDAEGRFASIERLRWSPDGRSIYVYGHDRTGRPGIQGLDLATGDVRTVRRFHRESDAMGGSFALSLDGARLYFRLLDPGAGMSCPTEGTIVVHELATGDERFLHGVRSRGSLALSPDGEELAFVDCDPDSKESLKLEVIPSGGGEAREVFRADRQARIAGITWSPDGREILFLGLPDPAALEFDIRIAPATGGEVEALAGVPSLSFEDPRLHPAGSKIAFRAGDDRDEIWALGGLAGTDVPNAGDRR